MTGALERFGRQSSTILKSEPLDAALEKISAGLAVLISDPDFVAHAFSENDPPGKTQLLHDPDTGFYLFAHVQKGGKTGKPHSHGDSWAIYANIRNHTDMTEYERINAGSEERFVLQTSEHYAIGPGQTRAYGPGMIHSTAHPENAWVVRMTGCDLDTIPRYHFSSKHDEIIG
jgi:predicted metal-dependent enzyme (double-stranded beta helix superfamily)